ncbi:MAG: hypothetical protein CMN28_13145 [Salinisphaeraceae bacterium]|nr:hypothetical protein [Salinisphaeraceae bacterium]
MCLIAFAWRAHPRYELVVAANRDEFHARPAEPAGFWSDAPQVYAGRDLQAGGAWCGMHSDGRFAAVTNYRDARPDRGERSRGDLVAGFLKAPATTRDFAEAVQAGRDRYGGFNLLLADADDMFYLSNRHPGGITGVKPGIHALSNGVLGDRWPKTERAISGLQSALAGDQADTQELLTLLADRRPAPDEALPDTGVGLPAEQVLSPIFVKTPDYGTRASTVILKDIDGGVRFIEVRYNAQAEVVGRQDEQWQITQ